MVRKTLLYFVPTLFLGTMIYASSIDKLPLGVTAVIVWTVAMETGLFSVWNRYRSIRSDQAANLVFSRWEIFRLALGLGIIHKSEKTGATYKIAPGVRVLHVNGRQLCVVPADSYHGHILYDSIIGEYASVRYGLEMAIALKLWIRSDEEEFMWRYRRYM